MVISSKVEITVLALKEQKSKDGTKTYYRLAVFDQINCESGMSVFRGSSKTLAE